MFAIIDRTIRVRIVFRRKLSTVDKVAVRPFYLYRQLTTGTGINVDGGLIRAAIAVGGRVGEGLRVACAGSITELPFAGINNCYSTVGQIRVRITVIDASAFDLGNGEIVAVRVGIIGKDIDISRA